MDIEAIVKKYSLTASSGKRLRAALTEQAAGYEQRIRQLEAERDDMSLVPRDLLDKFPELNTSNYDHDDVDELNAWGIELVLAAAPQQKQLCPKCGGSGEHALANTGVTEDDNCRACAGSGYVPQQKKEGE